MRGKWMLMVGVIFVIGISAAFYLYQKPTAKIIEEDAVYRIKAEELFHEYSADENKANAKYLKKVVTVEGLIAEVTEKSESNISVVLKTDDPMFGVSCEFSSGIDVAKFSEGQTIKVKGVCTGKLMDVILVRCVIEN